MKRDSMKAQFAWDDPLLLEQQLTQDERMVRAAAKAYCQSDLGDPESDRSRRTRLPPSAFSLSRVGTPALSRAVDVAPNQKITVKERRAPARSAGKQALSRA